MIKEPEMTTEEAIAFIELTLYCILKYYDGPAVIERQLIISRNKLNLDEELIKNKYLEGYNLTEIGHLLNTSKNTIKRRLQKMGVLIRNHEKKKKDLLHKKYGYRRVKGKTVEHQAEQRTIKTIFHLREQKLSFDKVAEILHTLKIPTKTKGKKWNSGMVRNIYEKNKT